MWATTREPRHALARSGLLLLDSPIKDFFCAFFSYIYSWYFLLESLLI